MTGIEMLEQAREHAPGAKFLLLTAYADTDVAIKAINDIGLDYYLLKPWDPPEERLYPVVDDLLGDWQRANPDHTSDLRVVGHRWSERSHAIKTFLARNHVPYRWYDVELDAEAAAPAATSPRRRRRPAARARPRRGDAAVARRRSTSPSALGLRTTAAAAAVRRLHRRRRPGRARRRRVRRVGGAEHRHRRARGDPAARRVRARRSRTTSASRRGLTGSDLTQRARRPGLPLRRRDGAAARRRRLRDPRARCTRCSSRARARSRRGRSSWPTRGLLPAARGRGLEELTGRGVYYGANASDASQCQGDDVYVVGAANSAGQAALNLARFAKRVVLVVRGGVARGHHVALPRRADHGRRPTSRSASAARSWLRRATGTSRRSPCPTATRADARRSRRAGCSSSSAPRPAPTGSAGRRP